MGHFSTTCITACIIWACILPLAQAKAEIPSLAKSAQGFDEEDLLSNLSLLSLEDLLDIEIVGASQYSQKQVDAPGTVITITRQQIEDFGYRDLSDVLNNLPGIDVVSNTRFGEWYSVRGITGNDRFLVLINGRRLNPAMGTMLSIGRSIPIMYADRIEIIYGASSIMYGTDAFTATINIVFNKHEKLSPIAADAHAAYGAFGTLQGGVNISAEISEDFSIRAWGRFFASDGFVPDGDTAIQRMLPLYPNGEFSQPINNHNVFFEASYKNFSVGLFRQYFDEGNGRGMLPSGYIMSEENKWVSENNTIWANYRDDLWDGQINVDVSYQMWGLGNETQFFKDPGPNPVSQYMTGRDRMLRGLITYAKQMDNLEVIVGAQFDNISSIPSYANDQVFNGNPVKFEGAAADSITNALTIAERRGGVFAQASYKFNEMFALTVGGRYDFSHLFDNAFNPRAAFITKFSPETSLKLIYGSAFQAPSLFYQYEQFGTPGVVMVPAVEQESQLLNQRVATYEAVFSHRFESVVITINGFYTDAENLIERERFSDSVYNKYFDRYTPGLRNTNAGSQIAIGGFAQAVMQFSQELSGYANYTYTDARTRISEASPELPTARIATHKAAAGLTFRNIFNVLSVSPSVRWVGPLNNIPLLAENEPTIDGYFMLNVHITSVPIYDRLQLFASFENLLDSRIEHVGIFNGPPYQTRILQPGLVWNVGIRVMY